MRTALVTGSAGFIGFHLSRLLLDQGWRVVGVDSHNDYYDPALKSAREAWLTPHPQFRALRGTVETPGLLAGLFAAERPDAVIHLAAQAGVRHSIDNPGAYVRANLLGTFELLEAARAHPPAHLLLASTSSVYGANTAMPYRETDKADTQMSFYAATKKSTEAMAHSYAHLFGLPVTMLRFFTVYGPWGRPDMAPWLFTRAILDGSPIRVFNHGAMQRDFTYVADLVQGVARLIDAVPGGVPVGDFDSLSPVAPFRVVNIGNGAPVQLTDFIAAIETATGRTAIRDLQPMQPGDVPATWADTTLLTALTGQSPRTPVTTGVAAYVRWFVAHYGG
ncbi:NAD-dependent epimerase/dehydratase family protein [Paracoccus luteus]|uniref:NAD-dependent epimerase/dehydratase family protein n=1 Tax=Paracoccus luteus TaxID=2508543 RepID=UPI0010702AB6|nr:NAD-dependent epimerase/dehydratase family protein [Paracoccus luteus]